MYSTSLYATWDHSEVQAIAPTFHVTTTRPSQTLSTLQIGFVRDAGAMIFKLIEAATQTTPSINTECCTLGNKA